MNAGGGLPPPRFSHLLRLTDDTAVFEHADHAVPRLEHGYCVDDVARALVVVLRELDPPAAVGELAVRYLAFLRAAVAEDGRVRNRMSHDRRWSDEPSLGDHWGRAVWALGTAVASEGASTRPSLSEPALELFERAVQQRSSWPRSMAHAAIGAAAVLAARPAHEPAAALLSDAAELLGSDSDSDWPHGRLTYANALLPEALLAAGALLGRDELLQGGLRQLRWLLDTETRDGHLSVTPTGGWEPGEPRPGFDQQPVEVATLADACARAHEVTGDAAWLEGLRLAVAWFLGHNDIGVALYDEATGGGCDGLTADGLNGNQGAESTIALISTLQHAARLPFAAPSPSREHSAK